MISQEMVEGTSKVQWQKHFWSGKRDLNLAGHFVTIYMPHHCTVTNVACGGSYATA